MRGEKMYCGLKKRAGLLAAGAFLGLSLVQGLSVQAGTWKDSTFVQQITASGMEAENTDLLFASDNIASGIYNGCKWVIDKNGTLTVRAVSKDGKGCDLSGDVWYNYKNDIVKVDVDVPYSSHLTGMFAGCKNVTEIRVKIDKTSGSAAGMFMVGGSSFNGNLTKLDVSKLNTSGITSMRQMFKSCNALKELDLSNWDTSNVTDMSYMFDGCYRIESLDVSNFKTGKVTTMEHMFYGCGKAKTSSWVCDVSKFDTRNLVDMTGMFGNVRSVKGYDKLKTSKVEQMDYVFYQCGMNKLNLKKWDVSHVKDMSSMFQSCDNLQSIDMTGWDTSNVTNMEYMFGFCEKLAEIDVTGFDTSSVEDIGYMFKRCSAIRSLDLSSFDLSKLDVEQNREYQERMENIIGECNDILEIKTPKNLSISFELPSYNGEWYRLDNGKKVTKLLLNKPKSTTIYRKIFADLKVEDWQYAGAQYVYFNGIMTGKKILSDKTAVFDAGAVMTRAEFVKALYNYEGMPIVKYQSRFKDVPNDKWYTKAILWAVRNEIVAGKGQVFDVEGLITRQEMAVMLYNYAQYKKLDVSNTKKLTGFADYKKADSYATNALKWTVGNGIINGKPSKNGKKVYLDPKGNATRGEAATILKTFVTIYKK